MLTHAERIALGRRARKQLARAAHSRLNLKACPTDPLATLFAAEAGRVKPLLKIKHERMAASSFGFFRGAVPIMAADLACHPNTGLTTQICGDAHVLNLGAYESLDGRVVFDINDFDETIHGPFEWDIKRLATSLLLAGREARIKRPARLAAVAAFLRKYRESMHEFASMPVLEVARHQIHRSHNGVVEDIFTTAEHATPERNLLKLTEAVNQPQTRAGKRKAAAHQKAATAIAQKNARTHISAQGSAAFAAHIQEPRRFKSNPPLLERLPEAEAAKVIAALTPYERTLQPERRQFLAQYAPQDVAFKVVGTGSVGLRDYCIYFEGLARKAGSDPLFIQIKEEPKSAYAPYLPNGDAHTHQGHRVMDGQRAMQLTSDPFLGYTTIDGRDYLVRQLNDHKAGLDLTTLNPAGLAAYADLCGELFARGHARAGDPVAIAAYIGKGDAFDKAIVAFAHAYADKTERDHDLLLKWLKKQA